MAKKHEMVAKAADDSPNAKLLEEIRDTYKYFTEAWREIREERQTDMRYLLGDPWAEEDKKARADAGRPCISHDELNQYVNQAVNNVRQNKRGIKIEPAGDGATDKTADFDQGLVRGIEYRGNGQPAYLAAFQAAVEGSYGFFGLSRRYVSDDSFDQEICYRTFLNPDSVLYDPDCKELDGSDARRAFVLEPIRRDEFARRFPNAEKTSFTTEDSQLAPDWIKEKLILVAEFWKVESTSKMLYLLPDGTTTLDLQPGQQAVKSRKVESRKVVKYLTNGVEILETNPQPGKEIPIIPIYGKEIYIDEGSGPTRKILSLIRLARDPQMSLAYYASQEAEEAGLTPKSPLLAYVGQCETDSEAIQNSTKVPTAVLQFDPVVDQASGQVLPLPTRQPFVPNFQAYEVAKEAARRAIQSAVGAQFLPTDAQRINDKSGVALNKIQSSQAVGSYHFNDNFDRAIQRAGRIILSWKTTIYDTERAIPLRQADDTARVVRINTPEPYFSAETNQAEHYKVEDIDHDVTVSTGPSNESTREAASDFLDVVVANLQKLPIAPPQAAKLLALAIKGKTLGPLGDQMAELIAPSDAQQELPPQAQQAIAQLQQQNQQLDAGLKQLMEEKAAKTVEMQAKVEIAKSQQQVDLEIARMKNLLEMAKLENQREIAEITTKAQDSLERAKLAADLDAKERVAAYEAAHELAMQKDAQAHAQDLAAQQHVQALEQQDQAGQQEAALSAQQAQQQAQQPETEAQ